MTHFEAYLLTRLDVLNGIGISLLILSAIMAVISLASYTDANASWSSEKTKRKSMPLFIKRAKWFGTFALLGVMLVTLIPTTKEMAFIYIAPAIVNNQDMQDTVKKLPSISKLGLEYVEEILKSEIKEKVNNNNNK